MSDVGHVTENTLCIIFISLYRSIYISVVFPSCEFVKLSKMFRKRWHVGYAVCKREGRADVISGCPLAFAEYYSNKKYVLSAYREKWLNLVNY